MLVEILVLLISVIGGYFFARGFAGEFEGDKIRRSLRFLIRNYYIHIHHWFYSSVILIIIYLLGFYHPVLYGVLIGLIIQGLFYRDRFVFIYHKKNFKKIYSKWKQK